MVVIPLRYLLLMLPVLVRAQSTCNQAGLCEGTRIGVGIAISHEDCQKQCILFEGCKFYTYVMNSNFPICNFFADCPSVNPDSCNRCVSSQPDCNIEKFLLVAGGVGSQGLSSVEVISLDESNVPLPDCLNLLGELDYVSYWSGGAPLRRGGYPTLCGGQQDTENGTITTDLCYQYAPEVDTWFESGSLKEERFAYGYDYSDSWGLIMTGGRDPNMSTLDSVEMTRDGFIFEIYQPMPVTKAYHCTAIVDDDRLIVAGGETDEGITSSAYMYSKTEDSWTQLPDMVYGRVLISCRTIANQETGQLEVIVPGGYNYNEYYRSDVEIYNVQSESWRFGEFYLPSPLTEYGISAYQDTIFVYGGFDGIGDKSDILEYNPATEEWRVSSQLTQPKRRTASMMVDTVFFPPCE